MACGKSRFLIEIAFSYPTNSFRVGPHVIELERLSMDFLFFRQFRGATYVKDCPLWLFNFYSTLVFFCALLFIVLDHAMKAYICFLALD